jgi:hypothetical protein
LSIKNDTRSKFIPPALAFSILDYVLALDTLVNFQYRFEKMASFSRRAMVYINEQWGVPKPFNVALFGLISFLFVLIFKKILSSIFGRKSNKPQNTNSLFFNFPHMQELVVIST